jgi:hypothetical protein
MELILLPEQYNLIWRVSWLSLISTIYALYRKHYELVIVPGGIFITSINYWRKPDYSWRRYVDMIYVQFALHYQNIKAYNMEYAKIYYVLIFVSIIWFFIGIYYYKKNDHWKSTYCHLMLHIMANIGNLILYCSHFDKNLRLKY